MNKVKIIAEIGPNHNGKIALAKKLICRAKIAGADYVKFQTYKTEDIILKNAIKAEYQIKNTKIKNETQFNMLKKLELSFDDFKKLYKFSKLKKIKFISTAFDIKSLDFINTLNPDFLKIPSGEITNYPLLKEIAKKKKKILLSTGMSNIGEIKKAIKILTKNGLTKKKITILQCNTEYPTPFEDVNLNVLETFKKNFKTDVGYSDHTLGIEASLAAVAYGAKIIEKHFTLDKNLNGPDHKASLDPKNFKIMVECIRNIEKAMGSRIKKPTLSEIKNIKIARKSIVAITAIKRGEVFSKKNIGTKRPGHGISPMNWPRIIGKKSLKNYNKDDLI